VDTAEPLHAVLVEAIRVSLCLRDEEARLPNLAVDIYQARHLRHRGPGVNVRIRDVAARADLVP